MSTISKSLAVLMLGVVLSGGAYAAGDPDDEQIAAEVQKQIDAKPSLQFFNIYVRALNHVVYLEGLVDTSVDQDEAETVARAVPGVAKVYDGLAINGNG